MFDLSQTPSIANQFIAELRDINVQSDRMRFRRNLERLGEILAYEVSKTLAYMPKSVATPLGEAEVALSDQKVVLATILRAGLPMHQGMLHYFDHAESAFVSAYRKHHKDGSFDVHVEYISCPDLTGKTLIIADPMLATGASMSLAIESLLEQGQPAAIHVVTAVAATAGVEHLQRVMPEAHLWVGAVDEELTAKSYIVPGLGDAGDLSYGEKVQE
ncbi:uracil phosphoribosyltransferase [Phaeodactylibacter sp.]|uniref:uracil phosphoribosyltransferase n=1 Tax=Phaeodactylibacter sp. TaxID=1940289 RepID=UPI0025F5FF2B|nr:uracil phosphoribosyltransferase [Phaeodactylibacter sp.]MCI4651616.1 uracil phosphoribosyltransferase [Phaeodactylibacter sp.]MCI5090741.1 uracil phosphoribosyltransferase [Phaeodactylibacter sp.]